MTVTRRDVLERLGTISDADSRETATVEELTATLDADEAVVRTHLEQLAACELARARPDGRVRITITGEELLELDPEEVIIVEAPPDE